MVLISEENDLPKKHVVTYCNTLKESRLYIDCVVILCKESKLFWTCLKYFSFNLFKNENKMLPGFLLT